MPKLIFVEHSGRVHEVDAEVGASAMQAAIFNDVSGIAADCGGACACATCHVYVDQEWWNEVGGPSEEEKAMLEEVAEPRAYSRLSCQIEVTDQLAGLRLEIPERQGV
jgi:ferredoxin, 2Fe-2S